MRRLFCALLAVSVLGPAVPALAGELQDDLKARRARVRETLGPETMLILWSAEPKVFSRDVDYEFRQDHNLYYLTGIDQEETILVLMPGNQTRKDVLFIRDSNPRREHWVGHSLTREEATAQSGIDTIYSTSQFEGFVGAMLSGVAFGQRRNTSQEYDAFFAALKGGRARLSLLLGPRPGLTGPLPAVYEFANRVRERFFGIRIEDGTELLSNLRQIKTPYEQKVLTKSVEISNEAHLAAMRATRPGRFEYEVEAALEHVYLASGAMTWGYPSIVGSGPNATVLHYSKSSRRMEAGDLLLIDAAGSYEYQTGDITRTFPVSGTFTAVQKDLYRIVLAAQEAAMLAAKVGNKTSDIEKASEAVVKQELLKLGLITDAAGDQFRTWYTHGICHWIGMDVHDVGDYQRPLEPGMTFVIEPGLYIREQALADLPDTPANKAFADKVRPAVQKYKDIGVRIEDSFLLTASGLTRLSAKVPRTIEEIETFMRKDVSSTAARP